MNKYMRISAFVLCLHMGQAIAVQDDFKQPIQVDAQSQFVDGKKRLSVFSGDVHIVQGSLVIDAAEVRVDTSAGKGQEVFIATGNPASYQQLLHDGNFVTAQAVTIEYHMGNKLITLTGGAKLEQNNSIVEGETITFDLAKEQMRALAGKEKGQRVKAIFEPQED